MPTLYKPELTDTETPWLRIFDRMYQGLLPRARQILFALRYYSERELEVPSVDNPITEDEATELSSIARALTTAAVVSQEMRDGILVATLKQLAKVTSSFPVNELPAALQWELANNYRRGDERPGTFAMDIWGGEQARTPYIWGEPTPENMARAAERAGARLQRDRSRGRPPHPAHGILANHLGPIFRGSGLPIARHREKQVRRERGKELNVRAEVGPVYDFLNLVLHPLQDFLREHRLPPVTVESIVRLAAKSARQQAA